MVFDHWTAAAEAAAAINSLIVYSHSLPPLLFVPDFGHAAKRLPSQLIPSLFPTRGYSNIFSAATDEVGRTDGGLERMPSNARLKGFPRDIVHTSHTRARRSCLPHVCDLIHALMHVLMMRLLVVVILLPILARNVGLSLGAEVAVVVTVAAAVQGGPTEFCSGN